MSTPPKYLTGDKAAIREFVGRFDVFLFDCDGVLWSGDHVFPGTVEVLTLLRSLGKRLLFVTNNSTKSRADYKKRFDGLKIPVEIDEITTSAHSSALYIKHILRLPASTSTIFVIGEAGLTSELSAASIPYITCPSHLTSLTPSSNNSLPPLDPSVGAVLMGLDRSLTYPKIALAHAYITRKEATKFIATNTDATLPAGQGGVFMPGAGSGIAALERAVGRGPDVVCGKPWPAMVEAVMAGLGGEQKKERICMVGDRLETDIRFGIESGLGGTLAVLTGVMSRADIVGEAGAGANEDRTRPTAFVDGLGDLLVLEEGR